MYRSTRTRAQRIDSTRTRQRQARGTPRSRHVDLPDAAATGGVRHGEVIHVGHDWNLLVLWDDSSTSVIAPDDLVKPRPRGARSTLAGRWGYFLGLATLARH